MLHYLQLSIVSILKVSQRILHSTEHYITALFPGLPGGFITDYISLSVCASDMLGSSECTHVIDQSTPASNSTDSSRKLDGEMIGVLETLLVATSNS